MPTTVETNAATASAAIAVFEEAIIGTTPTIAALPDESRSAHATRCLASKGNMALSISFKAPGGDILFAKAYGIRRNASGLAAALEKDPKDVEIPIPDFCSTPELVAEWKEWQLSVREQILADSVADTDEFVGYDVEKPVSVETVFQAASISKALSAVAVMRLVQKGLLDIDADINQYLEKGDWKLNADFPAGILPTQATTIRKLLGHAAGTSVSGFGGYRRNEVKAEKVVVPSTAGVLKGEGNSGKVEISSLPSLVSQYSGGGTTVVQHIVELVTGKPFYQVLHEEVFEPLGMKNSSAGMQDSPNAGDFVCAHCGPEGLPAPGGYNIYPETAAAGVWTTATDLNKASDAVFKSLHGVSVDGSVYLSQELTRDMLAQRFPSASKNVAYGVGWGLKNINGSFLFSHTGGNEGFRSICRSFADSGAGFSWLLSGEEMDQVEVGVNAVLKFLELPIDAEEPKDKKTVKVEYPASIAQCCGEYVAENPLNHGREIRVQASDEPNELLFTFDSLSGPISKKPKGVEGEEAFTFELLPRLDVTFTVVDGKEILSWSGHVFNKI
ncbi:beta-lactamase/transpeptidase-like protein [Rhizoclosmatium globosum]|uniref:Beta-lactamase/transpeptidase-like protein n=1 Tax=Rhizoclosmatium globosum TaxID=329046 RepID=A0A1Y2CCV2_9FUNG|nr:beta-lactamase/transpeptidase-like protein [Rhizoclosmatium globosum]|eukprot:ORY44868.1 beta-lactamase/transpeptidase-like protein [Rhizoclosmatium globosum]